MRFSPVSVDPAAAPQVQASVGEVAILMRHGLGG
jgi:hypothetical protein